MSDRIFGCRKWADKDTYFSQKNNCIEKILKFLDCPTKLETCGPTATCSCLAVMDKIVTFKTGAEKICFVFRLTPSYKVDNVDFLDGHREYVVTCRLSHEGGSHVGSCTTIGKSV